MYCKGRPWQDDRVRRPLPGGGRRRSRKVQVNEQKAVNEETEEEKPFNQAISPLNQRTMTTCSTSCPEKGQPEGKLGIWLAKDGTA